MNLLRRVHVTAGLDSENAFAGLGLSSNIFADNSADNGGAQYIKYQLSPMRNYLGFLSQ